MASASKLLYHRNIFMCYIFALRLNASRMCLLPNLRRFCLFFRCFPVLPFFFSFSVWRIRRKRCASESDSSSSLTQERAHRPTDGGCGQSNTRKSREVGSHIYYGVQKWESCADTRYSGALSIERRSRCVQTDILVASSLMENY